MKTKCPGTELNRRHLDFQVSQTKITAYTYEEAVKKYLLFKQAMGKKDPSFAKLSTLWMAIFKGRELASITTDEIEDTLNKWVVERKWSPASRNNTLMQLSGLFRWAITRKWIDTHPITGKIPTIPANNARTRWLRPPEVRKIMEKCPGWLRVLVEVAVKTGMRLSEVTELRIKDYHLDSKGQGYIAIPRTKNGSRHVIPIEGRVRDIIESQVEVLQYNDAYLFPGPLGGCARMSVKRNFKNAVIQAGLPYGGRGDGVSFHTLRHSFASIAGNNGVPINVIQQMGNWRSYSVVSRYTHLASETVRNAASQIDEII